MAEKIVQKNIKGLESISSLDHMGAIKSEDLNERWQIQKMLFDKYVEILNKTFGNNWQLCAFKQPRSILNNPVANGEAASINYLETWANGLLSLMLEKRYEKGTENLKFNIGIAARTYNKNGAKFEEAKVSGIKFKNSLTLKVNTEFQKPYKDQICELMESVFQSMAVSTSALYASEYLTVLREKVAQVLPKTIVDEFNDISNEHLSVLNSEERKNEIDEYKNAYEKYIKENYKTDKYSNFVLGEIAKFKRIAGEIYSELAKSENIPTVKTFRKEIVKNIREQCGELGPDLWYKIDNGAIETIIVEKQALQLKEYRRALQDCITSRWGVKASRRWKDKVNFYTINSMNYKLEDKNKVYKSYYEDIQKGQLSENDDSRNVTLQFLLTIADCFANSYLHRSRFVESFEQVKSVFEYDVNYETDFRKCRELENDIFANKIVDVIQNLILSPKLGHNVEKFIADYKELQKRYAHLLDKLIIPRIIKMNTHIRESLFDSIKGYIKTEIKNINVEEIDILVIKVEELSKLYGEIVVCCEEIPKDIQKFGSDIYLFLANRYQNKGNSIGANEMCERAYALRDSWEDEQVLVYGLLTMNGLNDKYQFNEVYDKYYDRLKQLKRNSFSTFLGEHRESREIIELRGKLNSIFIESRIANGSADWAESRKAYKTGVECFDNWADRQHIMFHFVRAALAANRLRVAKSEFLSSLKEEYSRAPKKGNFSIIKFLAQNKTSLDENDFYDANTDWFRAYVYLNYLTLVRELFNKNNNEGESLVQMFFHTDRILASLNAMEKNPYPSCLIYWRIAQIYRCKFEQSYANDSLERSVFWKKG